MYGVSVELIEQMSRVKRESCGAKNTAPRTRPSLQPHFNVLEAAVQVLCSLSYLSLPFFFSCSHCVPNSCGVKPEARVKSAVGNEEVPDHDDAGPSVGTGFCGE